MTAPAVDRGAEWALVAAARTDPDAFAHLYRAHHPHVLAYLQRKVGQRELAEDLTADVFVRALTHLDRVEDTGHAFGAWLVTIARNLVHDHWKRSSTQREQAVEVVPDAVVPGQRSPIDAVETAELLHGVLAGLPPADRAVLVARYLHELTFAEIAAEDGRTVGAIKLQRHRALARARRHLGVAS